MYLLLNGLISNMSLKSLLQMLEVIGIVVHIEQSPCPLVQLLDSNLLLPYFECTLLTTKMKSMVFLIQTLAQDSWLLGEHQQFCLTEM